jgi:hypothetical protein
MMHPMFDIEKARTDIEARNRIRLDAQLAPIAVGVELHKRYQLHRQSEFEQFFQSFPLRKRVDEKLLQVARRMQNNPDWLPTGVLSGGRLGFYVWTRKVMMRIWRMQHRPTS